MGRMLSPDGREVAVRPVGTLPTRPTAERMAEIRQALGTDDVRGILGELLAEINGLTEELQSRRGPTRMATG